ncbi:flagellar hook-length control protein FliK [Aestuariicoccus sp. KMU-90]|uniref:Flagellar hook-length control protein FliK n=1 Tax=Thetidibacter halocola TaxID=2827239 RepID=A0A8J7W9X1_9RHOB|nr:flagellar hook-length control protein FliK [Thetidibacter halocola]
MTTIPTRVIDPFIADPEGEDADFGLTASGDARLVPGMATVPTQPATPMRADPQAILRQVAEALPGLSEFGIEIRLSPEELGPVRMHLMQTDGGMMVHVQADRPETLDLLRRHIDQLARNLAEAGHDASGFTFSDGKGGQQRGSSGIGLTPSAGTGPEQAVTQGRPAPDQPTDGIDILL